MRRYLNIHESTTCGHVKLKLLFFVEKPPPIAEDRLCFLASSPALVPQSPESLQTLVTFSRRGRTRKDGDGLQIHPLLESKGS